MPTYTSSLKVADLLLESADFAARTDPDATPPFKEQVEALIDRTEDKIDRITRRSWKTKTVTNEEHEFNFSGFKTKHAPLLSVTTMEIYQGDTYRTLVEGRNQEFFAINELSMIYFTRFFVPAFVLPIAEGPASPMIFEYAWRYPIRVSYTWGEPIASAENGLLVEDVCTKLVAIDLLQMHERSIISKMGVNRQDMGSKIKHWQETVEWDLASISQGITVW